MSTVRVLSLAAVALLAPVAALAQSTGGAITFEQRCASCHENHTPESRAPNRQALLQFTPERVLNAITTGPMAINAEGLTDAQKKAVAETVAGRPLGAAGAGSASAMKNRCEHPKPMGDPTKGPSWNGWSPTPDNARFQSAEAAGIAADQVPTLKLKWAFGFPGATAAYGQPTVVAGRVFAASDAGFVYSLDAATGCVYWSFEADTGVRGAINIGPIKGTPGVRYAAFFGDIRTNTYAIDADTGKLIWRKKLDDHPFARISAAPKLVGDRLIVPVASWEEAGGPNLTYPCCTFRGSLTALDSNTGNQLWKSYSILEAPKPVKKNSLGTQLYGPAGGGIWDAPTVDIKRKAIYAGIGNGYTAPAADTVDSIMAFDLETGRPLWWYQTTKNDAWVLGCRPGEKTRTENCPDEALQNKTYNDVDLATSPMLRTLPDGRSILIAGQQTGLVYAVDPDKRGAFLWQTESADSRSSITFGGAADAMMAYYPTTVREGNTGGLAAFNMATGERVWFTPAPPAHCPPERRCSSAQNGAATAIPGAVFSGAADGMLRGYAADNGKIIWEFDTAQEFQTVNGVPAHGGTLNGPGAPTIVGGMVFIGSGYSGALGGNVLLAFGLEK